MISRKEFAAMMCLVCAAFVIGVVGFYLQGKRDADRWWQKQQTRYPCSTMACPGGSSLPSALLSCGEREWQDVTKSGQYARTIEPKQDLPGLNTQAGTALDHIDATVAEMTARIEEMKAELESERLLDYDTSMWAAECLAQTSKSCEARRKALNKRVQDAIDKAEKAR